MMAEATARRATRREWIGLGVLALPCMLYSMDLTLLNLALPKLSASLEPSAAELLWIVDIYGFLVAAFLITMGTLGDRIGRRRLLMVGASAFAIASVLAATSNSAPMLIAARAALGVAGATLAPSTLSLVRNMFLDPEQRSFAIGIWVTSYSVGAAIGPLVGGVLLEYFSWESVFLVGVPVMGLLLLLGPRLLPEFRDAEGGALDLRSVALSLAAVLAGVYGIKHWAEHGASWLGLTAFVAGAAFWRTFVHRQARLAHPLVDLRLLRAPELRAALCTYALGMFVAFGISIFVGQFLQLVLGLPPVVAGFYTAPWAAGFVVGSLTAPALARSLGRNLVIGSGLALAAAGLLSLTLLDANDGPALLVTASMVLSLGIAPVVTLATDSIIGAAPPERAGAASALSEASSELGGALGIALLGSLGAALYRSHMMENLPEGLTPAVAAKLEGTVATALAAAETMNGPLGTEVSRRAREAFTHSFRVTALTSAVLLMSGAVLVAWRARRGGARSTKTRSDAELVPGAATE